MMTPSTLIIEAKQTLKDFLKGKDNQRETLHPWRKSWEATYLHSMRVEQIALQLANSGEFQFSDEDILTLQLAAVLHDIGRLEGFPNHAPCSAKITREWLEAHPEIRAQIPQPDVLLDLIRRHSDKDTPADYALLAVLVDADNLDEMGAMSISMCANWVDRTSPFFFYDMLDMLKSREMTYFDKVERQLNTKAAKEYLKPKRALIEAFTYQLARELAGVERTDLE
jgi:HD superfamily phosphodiesterase